MNIINIIFLAAGVGSRLYPMTKNTPKCLLKINNKSVLERNLDIIDSFNISNKKLYIVTGFQSHKIKEAVGKRKNINFLVNPFFKITNSVASLWLAKDILKNDVLIINADICFSKEVFNSIINSKFNNFVVCDSSKKCTDADYKISLGDNIVSDMGKILKSNYFGEYSGITKLDKKGCSMLYTELNNMMDKEEYTTWYETAILNIIKQQNFKLNYLDIAGLNWTELDSLIDLEKANNSFK